MAKARGKYANMMLIDADTGPIGAGDASPAVGGGSSTVKLAAGADLVVMGDGLMVGRRGTRVLRFPVDASALLAEYPFTEGGVQTALDEASPGDVVSLPVGVLAGDYEIPAEVTVVGTGLNTVLTGTITGDGLLLNVQRSIDYPDQIISTADHAWLGDTVMRDLDPDGDNLWRLGDDGLRWAQAWINYLDAQDVTIAATLDVGGTTYAADMLPQETDAYDLGSPSRLWRRGYLSELRALLFAEETIQLVGGWLIIPKDAGAFEADVSDADTTIDFGKGIAYGTLPSSTEVTTQADFPNTIVEVDSTDGMEVGQRITTVLDNSDLHESEIVDVIDATHVEIRDAFSPWRHVPVSAEVRFGWTWVLVRSYDAVLETPAAEYIAVGSLLHYTTYHVTRDVDGSGANDWAAGTPFLVLGEEGDGRIELNAYDTPRIQILQQGDAYNLSDEIVRIGDLNGAFGVAAERYGFGVGDYAGGNYFRYDPTDGFLLRAGDGEVQIDETGITIGYDADAAFRLEADAGGTKHDVMYHDADADALHLESATQYWEMAEYQGAKWAMDGDFVKGQARPGSSGMDLALGNAANNWGMLSAHDTPGVILSVGTGATPTPAVDWREHRLVPGGDNARRLPQMVWVGAETDATKYLDFLTGVVYLWANLAAFNVDTGAAIGHCVCEIAKPGSGNTDRYFTSDRAYLYGTSGDLYLRLRDDGYAILYNTSAADVRWVGWVMYYGA